MKDYPNLTTDSPKDVLELLRYVTKERPNDVKDFNNLQNRFMTGRKVGKVPADFSDVAADDKIGDFNIFIDTVPYLVMLIDDSGTAKWARFTGDMTW